MFNFEFKTVDKSGKGLDTDKEDFYLEFIRMGVVKKFKEITVSFSEYDKNTGIGKGQIIVPDPLSREDFNSYDVFLKNKKININLPSVNIGIYVKMNLSDVVLEIISVTPETMIINPVIERLED